MFRLLNEDSMCVCVCVCAYEEEGSSKHWDCVG